MEEDSTREPELSEEQLREISGGCVACGGDKSAILHTKRIVAQVRAHAEAASDRGNYALAQVHTRLADEQAAIVLAAQERIMARGHGHVLDRPYVPDLNLPRVPKPPTPH